MLVRDCMTTPPVTIQPHVSLREALERMHEHRFRRLPVVDDQDRLVGIVSERDLLYASPPPAGLLDGGQYPLGRGRDAAQASAGGVMDGVDLFARSRPTFPNRRMLLRRF